MWSVLALALALLALAFAFLASPLPGATTPVRRLIWRPPRFHGLRFWLVPIVGVPVTAIAIVVLVALLFPIRVVPALFVSFAVVTPIGGSDPLPWFLCSYVRCSLAVVIPRAMVGTFCALNLPRDWEVRHASEPSVLLSQNSLCQNGYG